MNGRKTTLAHASPACSPPHPTCPACPTRQAVAIQPVVLAFAVANQWFWYGGGVYMGADCNPYAVDHAM